MRKTRDRVAVHLAGTFRHGQPIHWIAGQTVALPADWVEPADRLFEALSQHSALNIRIGDLLQLKREPAVAEWQLVLAELRGSVYLGRWARDDGRRALLDEDRHVIVKGSGLRVLGTIGAGLADRVQSRESMRRPQRRR